MDQWVESNYLQEKGGTRLVGRESQVEPREKEKTLNEC